MVVKEQHLKVCKLQELCSKVQTAETEELLSLAQNDVVGMMYTPEFEPAIAQIVIKHKKYIAPLKKLEKSILRLANSIYKDVKNYVAAHNITNTEILVALKDFEAYGKTTRGALHIESTQGPILGRVTALNCIMDLLMTIEVPDTTQFVEKMGLLLIGFNEKSSDERSTVYNEIKDYIARHKIINPHMMKTLSDFHRYKEGNSEQNVALWQRAILKGVLQFLLQRNTSSHHLSFVIQHTKINDMGYTTESIAAEKLHEWQQERERILNSQKSQVGHSLYNISLSYDLHNNGTQMIEEECSKNRLFSAQHLYRIFQKVGTHETAYLKKVLSTHTDRELRKRDIRIVCDFITDSVSNVKGIVQPERESLPDLEKKEKNNWSYDSKTLTFRHKDKSARFRKYKVFEQSESHESRSAYGYPGKVLSELTASDTAKKRLRSFSALYEDIVGPAPESDGQRAMYDACLKINQTLRNKCGLQEDFLIITTKDVRINRIYLS